MCGWTFGDPNALRFADGDAGGGSGDFTAPDWHGDFPSLANNPEASKAMAKYTDADSAMAGAADAQKKVGRPFWLPEDHSKLTDEQKTEIRANVAKMNGAPETPDGYDIKVPEGSTIDDRAMAEFKNLAHAAGYSNAEAQKIVDFQLSFVERVNKEVNEAIGRRVKEAFDAYSKEVGGDDTATLHAEWIKRYLKSLAVDGEGKPDEQMWKDFEARNFFNNQGKELILLRALAPAAKQFAATGGSPNTGGAMAEGKGALSYPEMKNKK
jgi:hypothetical protein